MLKGDAADEVAADPETFVPALIIIAIPALVLGVLIILFVNMVPDAVLAGGGIRPEAVLLMPFLKKASYGIVFPLVFLAIFGSVLGVGFLHLTARLFKGEGKFLDYYQTMGLGYMVSWGSMIPYIGFLFSLWTIPVNVVITARVHKLSTGKAVAVVLIPVALVALLVIFFIAFIGMGAIMGMAGSSAFQMTHQ